MAVPLPETCARVAALATEVRILRDLQGRTTLSIPDPAYVSLKPAPGSAFLGYRLLDGGPLWRETLETLSTRNQDQIAATLARFLSTLHGTPSGEIAGGAVPETATLDRIADRYAHIRSLLFPRMRPRARRDVAARFEAFLSDATAAAEEPVLIHGDFGPSNILFDEDRQTPSGIIDFGCTGLGDPAYDLAGLLVGYGEAFFQRLLAMDHRLRSLAPRARFFAGTFALEEALFGAETGDAEALRAGLAPYV